MYTTNEIVNKIESLKTARGGWTKTSLASLGVPWPPPAGWKQRLIDQAIDKVCEHRWYMREPGIQCVNCFVVWESDERT